MTDSADRGRAAVLDAAAFNGRAGGSRVAMDNPSRLSIR
jgi:hypothetical protein